MPIIFERSNPPLTPEELSEYQASLLFKIPDQFATFLTNVANGGWITESNTFDEHVGLVEIYGLGLDDDAAVDGGWTKETTSFEEDVAVESDWDDHEWKRWFVPFGYGEGGLVLCFRRTSSGDPTVYYYDCADDFDEIEWECISSLDVSFDEFIEALAEYEDVDDMPESTGRLISKEDIEKPDSAALPRLPD